METLADKPAGANLSIRAHTAIKEMILRRNLRGGDVISESRIADSLEVSRTPLREALQRLEGEGLVVKSANRSFVVRRVDLLEYLQSLNVRQVLEVEAAGLAHGRIPVGKIEAARRTVLALAKAPEYDREVHWQSDNEVHGLFMDACGNPVLAQMIQTLRVSTNLFEIESIDDREKPDADEHLVLLDALQHGSRNEIKRAVRAHIVSLKTTATQRMITR